MLFISSTAFENDIFEFPDKELLGQIQNIEISGGHRYYPKDELTQKIKLLRSYGVKNLLIHNYFPIPRKDFVLNFSSADPNILSACFDLAQNAISMCQAYIVLNCDVYD